MHEDIKKVIETSSLIVHQGTFIYAKVKTVPSLDNHFFVSKDADEITVITTEEQSAELDINEISDSKRCLLEIKFSPDSSDAAGFLAAISSLLAEKNISISVISTFSKDYILVGEKDKKKSLQILTTLGFCAIFYL